MRDATVRWRVATTSKRSTDESLIQRHVKLTHRLVACGLVAAALLFALGTTGLAQHTTGTPAIAVQGPGDPLTRSVRITSSEVTDPDVAVSPDGKWMIITALGHLFRLPTAGGPTQQLTSGPYYDAAPAISPDGKSVAFISDRETTSQGNVFVLEIASGRIVRLTDEFWADRPAWSPDGKSIAFLSYQLLGPTGDYWFVVPRGLKSQVKRASVADGTVETLSEPGYARAVAYLADGRPVWAEVEPESEKTPAISRLEVSTQTGSVTTALTVEGVVDRIGGRPRRWQRPLSPALRGRFSSEEPFSTARTTGVCAAGWGRRPPNCDGSLERA